MVAFAFGADAAASMALPVLKTRIVLITALVGVPAFALILILGQGGAR